MSNYCPDCGEPLEAHPGASFCPSCGSPVDAPGDAPTTPGPDGTRPTPKEAVEEMSESELDELLLQVAEEIDDEVIEGVCRLAVRDGADVA